MLVGLSPCPRHASGNVGDQLLSEVTMEIIEDVHGPTEFKTYFKREDLTSRLNQINEADAILLFGFEILQDDTRPDNYRIAEDLDDVEPPIIPDSASYRFYPGDEDELYRQTLGKRTMSFLDYLRPHCPGGAFPVRDNWVGRVLEQNGYETVLTGDPGWYDLDMLGEKFHRPGSIDQLVVTTPAGGQYIGQAKRLLRRLTREYEDATRIMSLHTAPSYVDRELFGVARQHDWKIHFASHETDNLELYRQTDLHIGYRLHGHLAHLRWRRPSVVIAGDSRAQGLTETFDTGGVRAFTPRANSGVGGSLRRLSRTRVGIMSQLLLNKLGFTTLLPRDNLLAATPNPDAIDDALEFVEHQRAANWPALSHIRKMIDETYKEGMRPYLKSALDI